MAILRQSVYYEVKFLRALAHKNPAAFLKAAKIILRDRRVWDTDILKAEIVGGQDGVGQIKNECRCLIDWLRYEEANSGVKIQPRII